MKRLTGPALMAGVLVMWTAALGAEPPAFPANALPVGGTIVGGLATISAGQNQLTITQSSFRAILNWQSFDIAVGKSVDIVQPSASSITLLRVTGSETPSQILGSLTANGDVWIINPNGVMFGPGSQVNVAGLLVTTANISNRNFMSGHYVFHQPGNPNAAISNAAGISVADAGLVAFVAPNVANTGLIQARLGKVQLASADRFTVDLYGDGLMNLQASSVIMQHIVNNSGVIQANGGEATLRAAAASNTVNSLINMNGLILAQSIGTQTGQIVLYAEGSNAVPGNVPANKGQKAGTSTVLVSGVLDASGYGSGQTGGTISVPGDNVAILASGRIDTSGNAGGGTVRIGGDFYGQGITPTALNTYVDANAWIFASAITSGNGGDVAVWSDGSTWFYGSIIAKGGANSGDGGFVHTSSHGYLDAQGHVDVTAPHGNEGTHLLAPTPRESTAMRPRP